MVGDTVEGSVDMNVAVRGQIATPVWSCSKDAHLSLKDHGRAAVGAWRQAAENRPERHTEPG